MKRTVIVVILAVAAMALLVSLAFESGSVPIEVHIAHHTIDTDIDRINDDFNTLLTTLESAWNNTQSPGEAARTLNMRLAAAEERLREPISQIPGNSSQRERIANSFEGFSIAAAAANRLAGEVIDEQTDYAQSVTYLRDVGPQIIQQLRDIRLDRVAADTFQLVIGTVDFATPDSAVQEFELRRLLVTLGRDQRIDANMPTEVERLRNAVETVLNEKNNIRSKLSQIDQTPVQKSANNLRLAAQGAYQSSVASVDQARLMLTLYALLLFAAVGVIAFRLQHSYRDLNRANDELAVLNDSLEQRVTERTKELAGALDELKESQVQLVQAEKMSSLGQLVAGISHEINTPLLYLANNAILIQERIELMSRYIKSCVAAFSLRSENFKKRAEYQVKFVEGLRDVKVMLRDEELEANLEEAMDLAKDSIDGLNDLTEIAQSLKDFSRMDRAPVGSFDVNNGLDKTLVIARNIVKHKAEVRKFYGEVPEIECSPSQINQVFLNLITNAAQAIDKQGEIVISTKLQDDDRVAITISDTGGGISEENLSKIRDPFFTTKEVGMGTGLGLSIVDEIVRSHKGELTIVSELNKGSSFTVSFPIKQAANEAVAASASADAPAVPDQPRNTAAEALLTHENDEFAEAV